MVLKNNNDYSNEFEKHDTALKVDTKKIQIPVRDGEKSFKLEGIMTFVDNQENENINGFKDGLFKDFGDVGVVITHPHPMLGGSYHNNVVLGVQEYLVFHLHLPTICFNFRGVGKSEGKGSWRGSYEREDVKATCRYFIDNSEQQLGYKINRIILVGYSYGSVIASSVSNEIPEVIGFTSINYPFGPLTLMLLGHLLNYALESPKPKFFINSSSDNFTGESKFKTRLSEMKGDSVTYKLIKGPDHFYFGDEERLAKEILKWCYYLIKK